MNSELLPYRPCVGLMILNREGKVFAGKRIDNPEDAWQMPQGGVDEGETPEAAALREMQEEIGTDKGEIIAEMPDWISYDLPQDLVPKLWGGRFRGQKQKWFAIRFTGTDADICIATEHPEFSEWKWVEMADLPSLIVPFKRKIYETLVEYFRELRV